MCKEKVFNGLIIFSGLSLFFLAASFFTSSMLESKHTNIEMSDIASVIWMPYSARLLEWYKENPSFPVSLNLDPGAINLPYEPDVDIRDYIDIRAVMESYNLGPNGSLVMASDMIATRLDEIQIV